MRHWQNSLVIRTPEGVEFAMELAGPMSRYLAWLVDMACISASMTVLGGVLRIVAVLHEGIGLAVTVVAGFVISTGYAIVLEWLWRGQTLGKRVLRLRVVDEQGLRLTFSQVAVRNLLRAVDSLPLFYLVGGVACLASRYGQRLGDIAASTVVVRIPDVQRPNVDRLMTDKYNSLRDYPHLVSRMRQAVSPEEAFLALHTLLRRDQLSARARIELFHELASHFQSLVKFPPEALEGLSDESYLRNVVDVVFRSRTGLEG